METDLGRFRQQAFNKSNCRIKKKCGKYTQEVRRDLACPPDIDIYMCIYLLIVKKINKISQRD